MKKIELIFPRFTFTGEGTKNDNSDYISRYQTGGCFSVEISAPGYGHILYEITRIDENGIWGVEIDKTCTGELTVADVI